MLNRQTPSAFRAMTLLAWVAALTPQLACNNFAQQQELEDIRVLAMRTEPAEILYSPLYSFLDFGDRFPGLALQEWDVDVTVYAFDPRGALGPIDSTMQFCPDGQQAACLDFDHEEWMATHNYEETGDNIDELRPIYVPEERTHLTARLARDPAGPLSETTYSYRFSTAVIDSLLRDRQGNGGFDLFPRLPRFVFDVQAPAAPGENEERAYKRLPMALNLSDPDLPPGIGPAIAQLIGVKICDVQPDVETFVEGPADCIFDRPANSNPVVVGFNFFDAAAEQEEFEATGEYKPQYRYGNTADFGPRAVISARGGATLDIRPVFPENSRERYQVYTFDLDNQRLTLENRFEDFTVSWYTVGGSAPALSDTLLANQALEVSWTLPRAADMELPSYEEGVDPLPRAALVGVVRDQRGGVFVTQLTVELRD